MNFNFSGVIFSFIAWVSSCRSGSCSAALIHVSVLGRGDVVHRFMTCSVRLNARALLPCRLVFLVVNSSVLACACETLL